MMWDYVGIVRQSERLVIAHDRISAMAENARTWCRRFGANADLVELRNVTLLGELIIRSAIFRRESRGLHSMIEFPATDPAFCGDTMLSRDREEPWIRRLYADGESAR
jgi:L-aspartate oxidase